MKGQSDADVVKEQELRGNADAGKQPQDATNVNYMGPDQGPFKCGHCEYFIATHGCQKVEGWIDSDACCNLFEKGN